jgi:hypothetical protein
LIALPGWDEKLNLGVAETAFGEVLSVILFASLCVYVYRYAKKGIVDQTVE